MLRLNDEEGNADLAAAFARLRNTLRSYMRRRISDPAQAEDVLQDVFMKALAAQRAGRRVESLTGWLYAAARTTLADYYRAKGVPTEALDDHIPNAEVDDLQLHQELALCLRPFVEDIAPLYKETLLATEFHGQTMRSLAQAQGVSISAIKSRAARARAMLKAKLLACCHVEMADGLVSDYKCRAPSECSGKCA